MLKLSLAAALLLTSAGAVFADGPAAPAPDPVVIAPAVSWAGFYAGLSAGRSVSGSWAFANNGVEFNSGEFVNGNVNGLFVGYNWQRGNLVYGAELAYSEADVAVVGWPASKFDTFTDIKGRVGYAAGKAMVYGTAGYMVGDFQDGAVINFDLTGMTFGVGVEYKVSSRFVVGLEYLNRQMEGTDPTRPLITMDTDLSTVSLRAALTF